METFNTPQEILQEIGSIFEFLREEKNEKELLRGIKASESLFTMDYGLHFEAILSYFIGNAWSYIQQIRYPNGIINLESKETEKQIFYYRQAYMLIKKCNDHSTMCQILTNLGNLFDHIGRHTEAQEYYNLCLKIHPNFGMAIGNRGMGLYFYARDIFDPVHQFIFLQYAHKYLLETTSKNDILPEDKMTFKSCADHIESAYPLEELDNYRSYKDFYKGKGKKEIEYREWCRQNTLFINPLNDVLLENNIVSHDCLTLPPMIFKKDENPNLIYHDIFNQLKQEYVSARYLFFEAISPHSIHFSDKNVELMDTSNYAEYSLAVEKIKIAFRICYSIFDKIGYFLNLYFAFGTEKNKVSFRNIWYNEEKKNKGIKETILHSKNQSLLGLFWLSKDFDEKGIKSPIEPEAKEIAYIRNFVEHKPFQIVESFNPEWMQETEMLEIDREFFTAKTLKILKLARAALMYLSFAVYEEEAKRRSNIKDGLIASVNIPSYKENYKI